MDKTRDLSGAMVSLGNAFNPSQQIWPEHYHTPGAVPGPLKGEKKERFQKGVLQLDVLAGGRWGERE